TVDTLVDWTDHDDESAEVITAKEFGMITGCDSDDAIKKGAAKIYNLITRADSEETNTAGRPIFHRFAKTDSMKVVHPPLSGDYTSLSDHMDLDESQMSYGTKFSTSFDSKSVFNDFVSCDDSVKSLEVNTNDFASSDSSVKSLEHQPNDSTSCASTSSVSTSVNEADIESNVGTPIQEPVIVQDLPSFTCNSFDKNEHTSRTACNKNGYFNKKAGHFRKHASSVSKPQPVPTGKPMVSAPVPTGMPNRPSLFPTDRGFSPSVIFGWWKSTARPMPHFDGQLLLSPQQVVLGNHIEKVYTGYPRTIVDLIHLHNDDNVADLLTKAFYGPRFNHLVVNIGMLNP
nr:hypothetical protein [Tanacetum cinerariifolium]